MAHDAPRQWHVYRNEVTGGYVLVVQSDLLEEMGTRLVVPVLRKTEAPRVHPRLTPVVLAGDEVLVTVPLYAAAIRVSEIGALVGSAEPAREEVTHALDMILSGV